MRDMFSRLLVDLTVANKNVVLLTGDHGYALFDNLRIQSPDSYINAGVAEQNMVGVAAGMAKAGFIPFVYGLSSFVPVRVLEQIKLDVCYEKLKVIFIGDGAGVVYSKLGVSHQSFEDIAVLRALPNLQLLSPSDSSEMKLCMEMALNYNGPTYLRIGKCDIGDIARQGPVSSQGISEIFKGNPHSPVVLATGSMVKPGMDVILSTFKEFGLYSIYQMKPVSTQALLNIIKDAEFVITMEEHSVYGGLGSLIAEITSSFNPKRVLRIGIEDCFTEKCGTYEYVMKEHGLDQTSLIKKIKEFC
jgi:transketolase